MSGSYVEGEEISPWGKSDNCFLWDSGNPKEKETQFLLSIPENIPLPVWVAPRGRCVGKLIINSTTSAESGMPCQPVLVNERQYLATISPGEEGLCVCVMELCYFPS